MLDATNWKSTLCWSLQLCEHYHDIKRPWAGVELPWWCLHEALGSGPSTHEPGMMAHACTPSTKEEEQELQKSRTQRVQGQPRLHQTNHVSNKQNDNNKAQTPGFWLWIKDTQRMQILKKNEMGNIQFPSISIKDTQPTQQMLRPDKTK